MKKNLKNLIKIENKSIKKTKELITECEALKFYDSSYKKDLLETLEPLKSIFKEDENLNNATKIWEKINQKLQDFQNEVQNKINNLKTEESELNNLLKDKKDDYKNLKPFKTSFLFGLLFGVIIWIICLIISFDFVDILIKDILFPFFSISNESFGKWIDSLSPLVVIPFLFVFGFSAYGLPISIPLYIFMKLESIKKLIEIKSIEKKINEINKNIQYLSEMQNSIKEVKKE